MEKTKPPITLQLTPTQIELANRMGVSLHDYAVQLAAYEKDNWPTEDADKDDEDLIDGNDPNNIEILNAPIATLKNMWLVKFGYRWIEDEDPVLDDVWEDIRARLENYGLLEERNYWYKLKEDL
jgi:hypothetical protein